MSSSRFAYRQSREPLCFQPQSTGQDKAFQRVLDGVEKVHCNACLGFDSIRFVICAASVIYIQRGFSFHGKGARPGFLPNTRNEMGPTYACAFPIHACMLQPDRPNGVYLPFKRPPSRPKLHAQYNKQTNLTNTDGTPAPPSSSATAPPKPSAQRSGRSSRKAPPRT